MKQGFLSVTSFSFLKKGFISQYDLKLTNKTRSSNSNSVNQQAYGHTNDHSSPSSSTISTASYTKSRVLDRDNLIPPSIFSVNNKLHGEYLWPNELTTFQDMNDNHMTIVPDGFLFPGQDDGGLYLIRDFHQSRSIYTDNIDPETQDSYSDNNSYINNNDKSTNKCTWRGR